MSRCKVCGREPARFRPGKLMALCDVCHKVVPYKVTLHRFSKRFWGPDWSDIPFSCRQEFYEDYLRSTQTVRQYCEGVNELLPEEVGP